MIKIKIVGKFNMIVNNISGIVFLNDFGGVMIEFIISVNVR